MTDRVFKKTDLTGTSNTSVEDAVKTAITRAAKTVRQMRWFEVTEIRGSIENGQVAQWQVTLKVGFSLED